MMWRFGKCFRRSRKRGLECLEADRAQKSRELLSRQQGGVRTVEVEFVTLGNDQWRITATVQMTGAELRVRAAVVAAVPERELVLLCGASRIDDEEAPLLTRASSAEGSALQVTLLRTPKRYALIGSRESDGPGAEPTPGLALWDLDCAEPVKVLQGTGACTNCIALNWEMQCALSGGGVQEAPTLDLWDLVHGRRVDTLIGHEGTVLCMAVDWPSQRALTGSLDYSLKLWDLRSATCIATMVCIWTCTRWRDIRTPLCVAMDWARRRAVTGMDNGTLKMWNLDEGTYIGSLAKNGHATSMFFTDRQPCAVRCLDVDWDARRVLSGAEDKKVKLWDMDSCECTQTLIGHEGPVCSVSLHLPSQLALSGSTDGCVKLWDMTDYSCTNTVQLHGPAQHCHCVSLDWASGLALSGFRDQLMLGDVGEGSYARAAPRLDGQLVTCVVLATS